MKADPSCVIAFNVALQHSQTGSSCSGSGESFAITQTGEAGVTYSGSGSANLSNLTVTVGESSDGPPPQLVNTGSVTVTLTGVVASLPTITLTTSGTLNLVTTTTQIASTVSIGYVSYAPVGTVFAGTECIQDSLTGQPGCEAAAPYPQAATITVPTGVPIDLTMSIYGAASAQPNAPNYAWNGTATATVSGSFAIQQLTITKPTDGDNFILSENTYRSTQNIPFSAQSSDASTAIKWSEELQYETSGGYSVPEYTTSFTSAPGAVRKDHFDGVGGQLTSTATQNNLSGAVTNTITGKQIPADIITPYLADLYTGAGSITNLLGAIADVESGYKQFAKSSLYSISAYWPIESAEDGGSHIGLMQVGTVDNGMPAAFDWQQNADLGLQVLQYGLNFAAKTQKKMLTKYPGLRKLTAEEREDIALSYYRLGGLNAYFVVDTSSGSPNWIINTKHDALGVAYVKCVRMQTPPTPVKCTFKH